MLRQETFTPPGGAPVPEVAPIATHNPWLHPLAAAEPPALSERLIRALEAHAAAEAHDVVNCQQLAQRADDPVLALLVDLIVEDEQRHHVLLRSMIRRLQEEAEFYPNPVPSPTALPVPSDSARLAETFNAEMAARVRALIRDEHEGARHVRHLARQEPTLYDGLYPLLLETIARDSEKHATILRYVLRHIEERV
jgi:hypothetical protein